MARRQVMQVFRIDVQLRHSLECLILSVTSAELSDEPPSKRMDYCFFGHKSPEGRLSLYLFGGMQIAAGTRNGCASAFKSTLPTLSAISCPYCRVGLL